MTDRAANVIDALAHVIADMPGIGKDGKSEQGYRYRGIEAITSELQELLGKHGVVFVPRVLHRDVKDLTINNKPWTQDEITVSYTVYGPGGIEDRIEVGPVIGLGRDNSDKGANKAMTQAFKYALLQTLCIGDAKDDGDQQTHEADEQPDEAACSLCGEVVPGAHSDKEPMRQHRVDVHAWLRREDGTVAPPQDPSGGTHLPVSPGAPSLIPSHGDGDPAGAEVAAPAVAAAPADPFALAVDRLQKRLDKLPETLRRSAEDELFNSGFMPGGVIACGAASVPDVSKVLDRFEEDANGAPGLQARAAARAKASV